MAKMIPFDRMMKDFFPASGDPNDSPEYVKELRAERAELVRTGARIAVPDHLDNTGAHCREVGPASLVADTEHHDCCYFCNELGAKAAGKEPPT